MESLFVKVVAINTLLLSGGVGATQILCLEKPDHLPMSFTLGESLEQFFGRLASIEGLKAKDIVDLVVAGYLEGKPAPEEIIQLLGNLRQIVESQNATAFTYRHVEGEPRFPEDIRREPIIAFLDPTCETCNEALTLLMDTQAKCPGLMPPIAVRGLPSEDDLSLKAAVLLEVIKKKRPANYFDAFRDVLALIGSDADILKDVASRYLPGDVAQEEFDSTKARLEVFRSEFPGKEYGTPLVVYRGRILKKKVAWSGGAAFNPLRNRTTLLTAIRLIDAYDTMNQKY